jgi:hypothetical protein
MDKGRVEELAIYTPLQRFVIGIETDRTVLGFDFYNIKSDKLVCDSGY